MAHDVTMVSGRGAVTLPKEVRDRLGWVAGMRLSVEHTVGGVLLRPLTPVFAPTRVEDVFGSLKYHGPAKTVEEMDAAIASEVKRRHARGRY